jgi:hypothetical protein
MTDNDRIANLFGGDPGKPGEDHIDEMFGSLTEKSPGVFTSPVGLDAEELTTMAERLTSRMNQDSPAVEAAQDILDSGEDPVEYLERRGIPYTHERHGDDGVIRELVNPDPNFPDRPQHEDFQRISEIVRRFDELADKGMDLMDVAILKGLDMASLVYMAKQRALRALNSYLDYPADATNEETRLAASWLDGFMAGRDFGAQVEERIVLGVEDAQHRARGGSNE